MFMHFRQTTPLIRQTRSIEYSPSVNNELKQSDCLQVWNVGIQSSDFLIASLEKILGAKCELRNVRMPNPAIRLLIQVGERGDIDHYENTCMAILFYCFN